MNQEQHPLVSVIVPAYNAAPYLELAVRSALDQSLPEVEVVVVNDGSTDGTAAVLDRLAREEPRVVAVHQANAGVSEARNAGHRIARGEYLAYLDADDVFAPDKLERQVAHLRANAGCDLVYSDWVEADERLRYLREVRVSLFGLMPLEALVYRGAIPPSVVLIRASLAREVGSWDPVFTISEDWDYWLRCARLGSLCHLPGALTVRRRHAGQATAASDMAERMWRSHLQVADKHFRHDRRTYARARAAHHWMATGGHRQARAYLRMLGHLARFAYFARDPRRALGIVRITRAFGRRGGGW